MNTRYKILLTSIFIPILYYLSKNHYFVVRKNIRSWLIAARMPFYRFFKKSPPA